MKLPYSFARYGSYKPPRGAHIDWTHNSARALKMAIRMGPNNTLIDLVSNLRGTATTAALSPTASTSQIPLGNGVLFNGANHVVMSGMSGPASQPIALAALITQSNTVDRAALYSQGESFNGNAFVWGFSSLGMYVAMGSSEIGPTTPAHNPSDVMFYGISIGPTECNFYLFSYSTQFETTSNQTTAGWGATANVQIGSALTGGSPGRFFSGRVGFLLRWNRVVPYGEFRGLAKDPWSLFAVSSPSLFYGVQAAAAADTDFAAIGW